MIGEREERPWGSWEVLDEGEGFKVKRIIVEPRSRLSLQTHEHRSEQWAVVSGTATCLIDDEVVVVRPGEQTTVDAGRMHRIANAHDEVLVLIEVQMGAYCGEDDIVRLEDDYGRVAHLGTELTGGLAGETEIAAAV
ncbi:MAG: mannose-6-phosphate isomerase [Nocardioides sp.]|nr:mannose-6-phosphate isomerase [Nocardioides sp.]